MEHRQSSFVSKLPVIMATLEERKAELSSKKKQVLEAKHLGKDVKELEIEWASLESEINLLEHATTVIRTDLIQHGLLSVDDMKLYVGAGVTHDMLLVNGNL